MDQKKYIETIIDNHLNWYHQLGAFTCERDLIPEGMIDNSIIKSEEMASWKPIKSTLTNNDFKYVENELRIQIPYEFRNILMYKHFISLELDMVRLFDNSPNWKNDYLKEAKSYEVNYEKHRLCPIGSNSDYGVTLIDIDSKEIVWLDIQYNFHIDSKIKIADNLFEFCKVAGLNLNEWKRNYFNK